MFVGFISAFWNSVTNGRLWNASTIRNTRKLIRRALAWLWSLWLLAFLVGTISTFDVSVASLTGGDAISISTLELIPRASLTTVDLIIVMRTVRTAIAYRRTRYAAAIAAGKAVGMTFWAGIAGLPSIRAISFITSVMAVDIVVAEEVLIDTDTVVAG